MLVTVVYCDDLEVPLLPLVPEPALLLSSFFAAFFLDFSSPVVPAADDFSLPMPDALLVPAAPEAPELP